MAPKKPSPSEFMSTAPQGMNGNTPWAQRYSRELRSVVTRYASQAPRTLQKSLGPSELGEECDRQVVGKMAAVKRTNNVYDPWASQMGTWGHAGLELAFTWENDQLGYIRWVTEQRVTPDPGPDPHPGTADLYDAFEQTLVDHKFLGETSGSKVRTGRVPHKYFVQMLLYAEGYRQLGLPVKRLALAVWPRTKSSLDDMYVWSYDCQPEADAMLVADVLARTRIRQQLADEVRAGRLTIKDIPPTPSDESCIFCPLYRPQAAYDDGPGCAGTLLLKRGMQTPSDKLQ